MTTREQIRAAGRNGPWTPHTVGLGWRHERADVFTRGGHRLTIHYRHTGSKGFDGGITRVYLDGHVIGTRPARHDQAATAASRAQIVLALLARDPVSVLPHGAHRTPGSGDIRCPRCHRHL